MLSTRNPFLGIQTQIKVKGQKDILSKHKLKESQNGYTNITRSRHKKKNYFKESKGYYKKKKILHNNKGVDSSGRTKNLKPKLVCTQQKNFKT